MNVGWWIFETGWLVFRSISGESTDDLRLWIIVDQD
jgi:hypothetical protein